MTAPRVRETFGLPVGFIFSQSSLQTYIDCPRSFQLHYIDRVIWPAAQAEPAAQMELRKRAGQSFHGLVRQHRLGMPLEFLTPLADQSNVARWWQNYLTADLQMIGYTQHFEFRLSSPIGKYRILAKYDLLALNDGAAVIYDWKTSTKRPTDEWLACRWQTLVYRALLVQAGAHLNGMQPILPERITMIYWFADFPVQPASFPYDAPTYEREWSSMEALVEKISSATEFPPAGDTHRCHFCGYHSYCGLGLKEASTAYIPEDFDFTADFDHDLG